MRVSSAPPVPRYSPGCDTCHARWGSAHRPLAHTAVPHLLLNSGSSRTSPPLWATILQVRQTCQRNGAKWLRRYTTLVGCCQRSSLK